ncbi:MAG TPA: hypothetical protein VHU44_05480 [Acidobacteriaceae bacterium]|jgi:hypothetical protein|nr:hypothetical protein [Acidobacteriaceae bacterium]
MTTERFTIHICRHLKTNGIRCQSPALNGESFCYFHTRLHKDHPAPLTARQILDLRHEGYEQAVIGAGEDPMQIARAFPRQNEFNFPPLEDAESIQFAASMLFHAISQGQIHLRRARILRDILRVANNSSRRVAAASEDASATASQIVRNIEHTPEGVAIAPADDPPATDPGDVCTPEQALVGLELMPNQHFACNPLPDKILQDSHELTCVD